MERNGHEIDHAHGHSHEIEHEHSHCEHEHSHCEHAHGHAHCGHAHGHSHGHSHCERGHSHEIGCGCGHEHGHGGGENPLPALVASGAIFALALAAEHLPQACGLLGIPPAIDGKILRGIYVALYMAAYFVAGRSTVLGAVGNIREGKFFGEELLMSVASLGAVFLGEFAEAVAVMLFYRVGEFFQDHAVDRSRGAISRLVGLRPDSANVVRDNAAVRVSPEEVAVGEIVEARPGERIALDGTVVSGESFADTSALTGESVPRRVRAGDQVLAGFVNVEGVLRIRVDRPCSESAAARILRLTEEAGAAKARSETMVARFARVYTPAVCGLALALALVPTLALGNFQLWAHRALMFLVVSCPCALVISVPLTFFCGIGAASRRGILVKGSNFMESLAKIRTAAFDKTGTLTEGVFEVAEIAPNDGTDADELLRLAAAAERGSNHPIAQSLRKAAERLPDPDGANMDATDVSERAGLGITATVGGRRVAAGNARLMREACAEGFAEPTDAAAGTEVHVSADGRHLGRIVIADRAKPGAAAALAELSRLGVGRLVMLTGDSRRNAEAAAKELGVGEFRAELLPEDKVRAVEELLSGGTGGATAFVGDGVNDAPVLSRADVGIAMGALGSDAAIEAADVVLMDDDIAKLAEGIRISRRTARIVAENIALSLGVKAAIMALSALGITGMWSAVFGDVGVCFLAILNATRAFGTPFRRK